MSTQERQAADAVLLVRPVAFHTNPETAASNAFQRAPGVASPAAEQAAAEVEFAGLVGALSEAGVETIVADDTPREDTPDAVFPNNWVSFHADGTVVLYPMMAENRRAERRMDIIRRLSREWGFHVERVVDLSGSEKEQKFLEATGSMVLDRVNRVAYACVSPRTHVDTLAAACQLLGYEPLAFAAVDADGVAVYHTNVLMSIGADFAVLCEDAISEAGQREAVRTRLEDTGHEILPITLEQMSSFAGNVLELASRDGNRIITMSARAWASLDERQRGFLASRARIVSVPVGTIETAGGGSVRCMIAEVHLPRGRP
ncbi:MAG: arginine deiminase-related protein [Gammaproteobacteria bacterium]